MLTIIGSLALLLALLTLAVMAALFWRLELGLLGLIAFLPFERIPSLDMAGFTVKINHIFGGLVLLVWLLTVLVGKRRIQPNPLVLPTLLFMASLALSLVTAEAGQRAVFSLAATFFSVSLGLLIPQLLVKTEQLPLLLKILGATTLLAVVFGFYQFLGDLAGLPVSLTGLDPGYTKVVFGFPRIQAFSQEPLYFGNFLLLPFSLGIALLALPKLPWRRPLLISALVLVALAFIFTLSRGAFLGLAASLLVLLLILGKHLLKPKLIVIGLATMLVVGLTTVGFLSIARPGALTEFTSHVTVKDFGRGDSTVGRLSSWYQAVTIWQTSPWVGVGFGNFGPASLGYPAQTPAHGWPIVNNQYLELLAETGLIGTLTFVIFILYLLGRSCSLIVRQPRGTLLDASLVGATAALIGILVQYNFFSTLYINPIWITIGLLVALQNLVARIDKKGEAHEAS
ncbi:MAG: O-antigen ligase family protein [Patescibacteria group bacterium]